MNINKIKQDILHKKIIGLISVHNLTKQEKNYLIQSMETYNFYRVNLLYRYISKDTTFFIVYYTINGFKIRCTNLSFSVLDKNLKMRNNKYKIYDFKNNTQEFINKLFEDIL